MSARRPFSQFISVPFQKRNDNVTITGIADAGIDQGLRAKTHCPNVCLLIVLLLVRRKDSKKI